MVGFPHSEILGSKPVRGSPRLIAAYYVLHRLHAPRHPLDAFKALDRSHYQCPQPLAPTLLKEGAGHRARTNFATPCGAAVLIGQIKKPKFTCSCCLSPGCGSNKQQSISLRCRKIRQLPSGKPTERPNLLFVKRRISLRLHLVKAGGARRDRTDDLMLAKHALSQLSYGPLERIAAGERRTASQARVRDRTAHYSLWIGGPG